MATLTISEAIPVEVPAPRCNVAAYIKEQIDHCRRQTADAHPEWKREVEWAQLGLMMQRELCQHEGRCKDCDPTITV
jgi:hypothetical protein